MWVAGFSIDNISLNALAVSVGFVVDDAIVVIENVFRNLEKGMTPLRATIEGARQIGFTVLLDQHFAGRGLHAPALHGRLVGRLFSEFSLTLTFAIDDLDRGVVVIDAMICAHFVKAAPSPSATWLDRVVEKILQRAVAAYASSLDVVLRHSFLTLLVFLATIALTAGLYVKTPKGFLSAKTTPA